MYVVTIELNGVVVATVKWHSGGGHNTVILGTWGAVGMSCANLAEAVMEAQRKIAGQS